MSKKLTGRSAATTAVFIVIFVLFTIYSLYILYPYLYALNSALKADGRTFANDQVGISIPPHFENFKKAFLELEIADNGFLKMTLNSIWIAGGSTFLSIISSCMAAYVLCKYKFRGNTFLYSLVLITMMIPIFGALPAKYRLLSQLGWVNSPLYIISAACGFDFAFLIIYSFFKGISWDYAEAAFIDGAGHLKVFVQIMLPMAIPSITAIVITNFISSWNAYDGPLLYLPDMPTLSSGLFAYKLKMDHLGGGNPPVYFAGVLLSIIPILALFLIFQNTIMSKVYAGGLKG